MSKFQWDNGLTATLIDEIKIRRAFWDHKHPDYAKRGPHHILQQQVVDALKEAYPEKTIDLHYKGM